MINDSNDEAAVLFQWFRKKETPSLETQIQVLKELGIIFNLSNPDLISALLNQFDRQAYEKDPYNLLISTAGHDLVDQDGRELRMTHHILSFDTECVEEEDIYTRIVERFIQLTRGEVQLGDLDSSVDWHEGTASLSFTYEGKKYDLDVKFEDDWFDVSVLARIAAIVNKPGKEFVCAHDGQFLTIMYCSPEMLKKINRLTRVKFNKFA